MFSNQQVHVLLILWVAKRPLTHEEDDGREAISELFGETETIL